MKKIIRSTAVVLFAILMSMSSCKKLTLPSMKASFDGSEKNFLFRSSFRGDVPNVGSGFIIVATTTSTIDEGEYLALFVRGIEEKTYNLEVALLEGKYECEALYRKGGEKDTNIYVGSDGTIIIDKINEDKKKISGTFSFTLVNKDDPNKTIVVTEGVFNNLLYTNADLSLLNDFEL